MPTRLPISPEFRQLLAQARWSGGPATPSPEAHIDKTRIDRAERWLGPLPWQLWAAWAAVGSDPPDLLDDCCDFSPEGSIAMSDHVLALGFECPHGLVALGDGGDDSMSVLLRCGSSLRVGQMQFDKCAMPRIVETVSFARWIGAQFIGEDAVDEHDTVTNPSAAPADWDAAFAVWVDGGVARDLVLEHIDHPVHGAGRVVDRCHDALLVTFADGAIRRLRRADLRD